MTAAGFENPWLQGPVAEAYTRFARDLAAAAGAEPHAATEAFRRFGAAQFGAGAFGATAAGGRDARGSSGAWAGGVPLEAPALGITRELQQQGQAWLNAAREHAAATQEFAVVLAEIGATAGERFRVRLAEPDALHAPLRVLFDDWIECAESAYQAAAHGERFCAAQARLLNALAAWRIAQRPFTEQAARALDVPTRAEVDELQRTLHAMREELATLRARTAKPRRAGTPK